MNEKFFWWGEADLTNTFPPLYVMEPGMTSPSIRYGVHGDQVTQLLSEGFVEISTRSAHVIGLPT